MGVINDLVDNYKMMWQAEREKNERMELKIEGYKEVLKLINKHHMMMEDVFYENFGPKHRDVIRDIYCKIDNAVDVIDKA